MLLPDLDFGRHSCQIWGQWGLGEFARFMPERLAIAAEGMEKRSRPEEGAMRATGTQTSKLKFGGDSLSQKPAESGSPGIKTEVTWRGGWGGVVRQESGRMAHPPSKTHRSQHLSGCWHPAEDSLASPQPAGLGLLSQPEMPEWAVLGPGGWGLDLIRSSKPSHPDGAQQACPTCCAKLIQSHDF